MNKVEFYDQALIPFEDLNLFRLTGHIKLPWVNPVSFWVPRKLDIQAITAIARTCSPDQRILDLACGNGFLSYLLAEEIPVLGVDPNRKLLARTPYKHPNLELVVGTAQDVVAEFPQGESIDVVFNSWMPRGIDLSDSIYALNPKLIIFIRDSWGETGVRGASYEQRENYQTLTEWSTAITADIGNVFDQLSWMLEGQMYKYQTVDLAMSHPRWETVFRDEIRRIERRLSMTNLIDIRIRKDVPPPEFPINVPCSTPYPWEQDYYHVLENLVFQRYPDNTSYNPQIHKT